MTVPERYQGRPSSIPAIRAARERIRATAIRTPLVRLQLDGFGDGVRHRPDIYIKLENLQPINSFKLRGAANAVACLPPEARQRGVWTISAGNAGQGIAYAARAAGVACRVLVMDTAPETKVKAMLRLGAVLVKAPFDACWKALEERTFPGMEGTFIHPFDDDDFIAGNATMGLEIAEDLPNVKTVVAAIGGGGLVVGLAQALAEICPQARVLGAEPETAAPASLSFASGHAEWFPDWKASFVDGAGGKCVFPRMWERMRGLVSGSIVVSLDEVRAAMRLVAERARVIAEGAGACAVAAALRLAPEDGPVVAVISGGNIDLGKFAELTGAAEIASVAVAREALRQAQGERGPETR